MPVVAIQIRDFILTRYRYLFYPPGLNGRPEKLPDVCYSWWVLASLAILNRQQLYTYPFSRPKVVIRVLKMYHKISIPKTHFYISKI